MSQTLLSELLRAKALFQARSVAAIMGLPQPTSLSALDAAQDLSAAADRLAAQFEDTTADDLQQRYDAAKAKWEMSK